MPSKNSSGQPGSSCAEQFVHVIDDDEGFRTGLTRVLKASGLKAIAYGSAEEYMRTGSRALPGCVLLDIGLPGQNGMDLFDELGTRGTSHPVIFVTGSGDIPNSVRAMRLGAVDFLTKPVTKDRLLKSVSEALTIDAARRARGERLEAMRRLYQTRIRCLPASLRENSISNLRRPSASANERSKRCAHR
jgi:FixJ family two-component response regulator